MADSLSPGLPSTRQSVSTADDFSSAKERHSAISATTVRPSTATYVPIVAAGFANPLSSKQLQQQRSSVQPKPEKRRYSNASIHTLKEQRVPEEPPPLPASRGTDAVAQSVASDAPLNVRTEKQLEAGRNNEYYAGNLLFFGPLLNTRSRPLNILTFILIVLPAACVLAGSPELWSISPAIPIIYAYIFFLTISSFLHAAFSDPGILPRNLHPVLPEKDPLTPGQTTEWVMVGAMEVPTKYCKACNIWRPPRAHHCRTCDGCVETQDHHCVWLNNCVGRRNYRYFFAFVSTATLLAVVQIIFTLIQVSTYADNHNLSFAQAIQVERLAFAMFIYAVLALFYPFSLWGYHIFLMSRGETTREYLNSHKFLKKDRHQPFSNGRLQNLVAVLTRPRPPTYMRFGKRYEIGDLRYGYTKTKRERKQENTGKYSVEMKQFGV